MSLFSFFHKSEKKKLINAIRTRKKNLLKEVHHLFVEGKKMKRLSQLENHLLKKVEALLPAEKAAVDKVLAENKTEEQILDYMARIEKQILSLVESGDVDQIRTRMRKYLYTMKQLTTRIENLELSKKAQISRIADEEQRIERDLKLKNKKKYEEQKHALALMKKAVKIESKENAIARKHFYRSVGKLGTHTARLIGGLLKITADVAKLTGAGTGALAKAAAKAAAKV